MTTLQEQFEKDFPDKGVKEIDFNGFKYRHSKFNCDLDLREYKNLTKLKLDCTRFTFINLTESKNLTKLDLSNCWLTNVDFLNTLPNPEKLEALLVYNNNIQPTDISIFSRFVNLRILKIGDMFGLVNRQNRFYGSLKSYQNLTELKSVCIEATDVNEGLEYLPMSLAETAAKLVKDGEERGGYLVVECSPHDTNAKCSAIQNQLRPFNYDLEAWQLAHPEKMLISRPELFTNPDSKDKWINALKNKVEQSKQELSETEREKVKRIARLESKIQELETAKSTISQQTQTEFSTQNKSTQTDLTMEQKEY